MEKLLTYHPTIGVVVFISFVSIKKQYFLNNNYLQATRVIFTKEWKWKLSFLVKNERTIRE